MFAQTKIYKLHVDDFQTKRMLGGHFFRGWKQSLTEFEFTLFYIISTATFF